MRATLCLFVTLLLVTACRSETLVYFGTYTQGTSEGIYVSTLDATTGALSPPKLAAEAVNPSFVALHPSGKYLYAVSEIGDDGPDSVGVMAYSVNADGTLQKLNHRSTRGGAACHLQVHPSGTCLGVANYTGGSCLLYPLNEDGSLGEATSFHQHTGGSRVNLRRQTAPHAHSINFSTDGSQAFVADLGLDQVLIYDVDAENATMEPADQPHLTLPPGGGPRHFCFDPTSDAAFSNLELTSQVAMLQYDAQANTLAIRTTNSTLPDDWTEGNSTAECLVHPNGRYVYVSNRGHNSIAVFRFGAHRGTLNRIENEPTGGNIPRGFGITPDGKFLIAGHQKSGNVTVLSIHPKDGTLSPTDHGIEIDAAVNVRFLVR